MEVFWSFVRPAYTTRSGNSFLSATDGRGRALVGGVAVATDGGAGDDAVGAGANMVAVAPGLGSPVAAGPDGALTRFTANMPANATTRPPKVTSGLRWIMSTTGKTQPYGPRVARPFT